MTATTAAQMLVRLTGAIQIVLGLLFWTGNALNLVSVHMLTGFLLVLSLWALAFQAARTGVAPGQVTLAAVWGFLVVALGMAQTGLVPGDAHWVIQVIHLLVGVAAIGMAEGLAGRIKAAHSPAL